MKINLSKEEIKKGCELITNAFFGEKIILYMNAKDVNLNKHSEISYYRDFLQLVIEAINKKYYNSIYNTTIEQKSYLIHVNMCNVDGYGVERKLFFNDYSITEAKEKAISYVFDNMEN